MRKPIISIVVLLLSAGGIHAQESPTASGGEATGSGGTASYSIGQVFYTTNTGSNGSVAQGVQQPFEISTVVGINETTINLELSVYPNPTTNFLILEVADNTDLNYQLFDMQGKIIEAQKVNNNSTTITMENLATATYFLRVIKNDQLVKTFKIIKN